jgi:hypothetical protein
LGVAVVDEDGFAVGVFGDADTALDPRVINYIFKSVAGIMPERESITCRVCALDFGRRDGKNKGREGDEGRRDHNAGKGELKELNADLRRLSRLLY